MKITKQQLKQIIKEEFETAIDEKMGLPDNVPVEAGSTEDHKRRCKAAGVSMSDMAECMVNPEPFEKEKKRLDKIAYDRSADEQDKLRSYAGSPWLESKRSNLKQMIKEELQSALNEFELGFDVDDESDVERARDLEWIERERKKAIPAAQAVVDFLTSDEPAAMGMAKSQLMTRIKYFNALLKFLKDQNEEFYLQMYALGAGRDNAMNESMSDPDGESPIAKMGKEKGFPKAVAAMQGLARLDLHGSGNYLVKAADKKYFKGKLGQEIHGANGIAQLISDEIRNTPSRRKDGSAPERGALDHLEEAQNWRNYR